MADSLESLDWSSDSNLILLNPRWPREELLFLQEMAKETLKQHALRGHFVLASSGTSAGSWREIKLVFLSKQAVLTAALSVVKRFDFTSKDIFGKTLPEFHVSGLGTMARAFVCGGKISSFSEDSAWDAKAFLRAAADAEVSVVSLVPAQLHDLVSLGSRAPKSLRKVFIGGGVLSPELEGEARKLGWPLVVTYGMTETSAMFAVRADASPALGFEILPHMEIRTNPEGLLQVRGPSLATGFAQKIGNQVRWMKVTDDDGWFQTEDRVRLQGGRCFVEGRGRDFIKIGGESVNVSVLRGILESLVHEGGFGSRRFHLVAKPSLRLGSEIVLVYEGSDLAQRVRTLTESFNGKVLPFEKIRETFEVASIPRTELGKVREESLLALLASAGRGKDSNS